jgi:hypothetical protein
MSKKSSEMDFSCHFQNSRHFIEAFGTERSASQDDIKTIKTLKGVETPFHTLVTPDHPAAKKKKLFVPKN